MAQLTPLISTTQEGALLELFEQIKDTQAQKKANSSTAITILVDYTANLENDLLSFSGSLPITTSPDSQGRAILSAKPWD